MDVRGSRCHSANRSAIKVLGAKIVGKLDLSPVKVPFAITLSRCSISELMDLVGPQIPFLDLGGGYTGPILVDAIEVPTDSKLGPDISPRSGHVCIESNRRSKFVMP